MGTSGDAQSCLLIGPSIPELEVYRERETGSIYLTTSNSPTYVLLLFHQSLPFPYKFPFPWNQYHNLLFCINYFLLQFNLIHSNNESSSSFLHAIIQQHHANFYTHHPKKRDYCSTTQNNTQRRKITSSTNISIPNTHSYAIKIKLQRRHRKRP